MYAACKAVRWFPVGQHLGQYNLGIPPGLFSSDWHEIAGTGFPGIVHKGVRSILYAINPHFVPAETAVLLQSAGVLPGSDGTGTASYRLEICIRNASDHFDGTEDGRAHSVAAGNVLRTAFSQETWILAKFFAQGDRIVIISPVRGCDYLHARFEPPGEPEVGDIVVRDADNNRDVVVGAYPCKGPGGVAG